MDKLLKYVKEFNTQDEECYNESIKNEQAYVWMKEHIPYFDCPDKDIEKTYYYRWWVYRKHIRITPDGYVITEFMPEVPWASTHNAINAPAGHQISEGRWICDKEGYLKDYITFWIKQKGDAFSYSTWLISALWDYCSIKGDYSLGTNFLEDICKYYEKWEETHLCDNGLFWCLDDRDGMEYTISGTPMDMKMTKGFRPTLNSYMAADAEAIKRFAQLVGRDDIAQIYAQKSEKLKQLIVSKLWDGEFFKACHCLDKNGEPILGEVAPEQNVRELVGYIPWAFNIPPKDKNMEKAFSYLKSRDGFLSDFGLTTAEQAHERFMFEVEHECLWNGYIWPYATSQTLRAVSNLLRNYNQNVVNKDDFYFMLLDYARMHRRITEDGKTIMWIDEVMDPTNGEWSSREYLKTQGFPADNGGYERGKDYNHSTYCDIILSDLLGISMDDKQNPVVNPIIPEHWDYFAVESIELGGRKYNIFYDKNGTHYNKGKGIIIQEATAE